MTADAVPRPAMYSCSSAGVGMPGRSLSWGDPVQVNLKRERLELSPVYSTALMHDDHKVGYIRLTSFSQKAAADMKRHISKLEVLRSSPVTFPQPERIRHVIVGRSQDPKCGTRNMLLIVATCFLLAPGSKRIRCVSVRGDVKVADSKCCTLQKTGAEAYILDLRNNPGGLVRSGLDIARLFLDGQAAIFNVSGRDGGSYSALMQVCRSSMCERHTPGFSCCANPL